MIPFLVLSACSTVPKDRTIVFEGIENARELGSLPAYLEKALGFSAAEQEKLKEKYLH